MKVDSQIENINKKMSADLDLISQKFGEIKLMLFDQVHKEQIKVKINKFPLVLTTLKHLREIYV